MPSLNICVEVFIRLWERLKDSTNPETQTNIKVILGRSSIDPPGNSLA
jgi:hypothetical protein